MDADFCAEDYFSSSCLQTSLKISNISMARETLRETDFCCATDHFSSSYNSLNIMRRDNQLCDIEFLIGNKKITAHKNVLASYSDYFLKMFCGNFKNSQVLEINNIEITPNSFELLIDFMYTSHLRINDSNVQDLLRASSFLLLGNVKKECLKFLKKTISVENLIEIRDKSVLYKIDELYDLCFSYAMENYYDIVKSRIFLSFPFEFMIELIQSDELCAEEEMVFESIMLWLKHDINGRSKHLLELFKAVRLCLMDIDYLNNNVRKEDLIKSNPECMEYLVEVYQMKMGKDVDDLSSIVNVHQRKNTQIINKNSKGNLEYCTMINSSLKFKHSNEVFHQSASKMVSSYNIMSVMRKEGILCDLIIKIGSKKMAVHKIIIASNSEYFNMMLTGGLNESEIEEITINEIKPDILELLIDYMYTSNLKITEINVLDILLTSDLLLLDDIHKRCIEFLKVNINVDNCFKLKQFACSKNIIELIDSCTSFSIDNFTYISDSSDFLSLSVDEITELIQNDNLNAEEVKVFESVMCWIRQDQDNRSQYLLRLIESIRMSMIPFLYFNENIANDEMLKNNCLALLYETYKEYAKKFEKNDIEISTYYTNRQHYKNNKLILAVKCVRAMELQLMWFTAGSEIYTTKGLKLDYKFLYTNQCLILNDGRIFCVRCSECDKWPSSIFDGSTKSWNTLSDFRLCNNLLKAKYCISSMVELDGCLYVISWCGDFNCYNIKKKKKWSKLKGLDVKTPHKLIVSDGLIYLVYKFGVLQYCKNTNNWQSLSQEYISMGYGFACCSLNGFLYIIGGSDQGKYLKSVMKFNLSTKTWSCISDMHYARHYAGAEVVNGLIYVIGGGLDCDSVEVYDPQLDKWTLLETKLPIKQNLILHVIVLNPTENINPDNISTYYSLQWRSLGSGLG